MIYHTRTLSNGDVYVGFPDVNSMYLDPMPEEVKWWVIETIEEPKWERDLNSWRLRGVYLKPADVVVFKLKFG
jgi:hypothetical protein